MLLPLRRVPGRLLRILAFRIVFELGTEILVVPEKVARAACALKLTLFLKPPSAPDSVCICVHLAVVESSDP